MLEASCGLEVSEIVLTEWRNPEKTEDVMASGSSKDVSNSVISMESVRMESKPCQGQLWLGLERINPHTPVPEESGKWWHLICEPRINMGMSNKPLCRPGVRNLINLIPSHHTRITRFNAHCRFRVDFVIGWNQTWNRRLLHTMKGRCRDQVTLCQALKAVCPII